MITVGNLITRNFAPLSGKIRSVLRSGSGNRENRMKKSNTPDGQKLPAELEATVEQESKFNQNRPEKQPEEDKTNGKP